MYSFRVNDMTCGHCVDTVERAVKAVDPSAEVRIDLAMKEVAIGSSESAQAFSRAMKGVGYTPVLKD